MSSLPLVSILIPLYNEEHYIEKTIESCLSQTYPNIEVIVVDDHSTDHSLVLAQKHESERVHVLVNPDKGACAARNYAFSQSKGEYVKFHDADDYCTPGLIERQMTRMLEDGDENTIVYSPLRICNLPESTETERVNLTNDFSPAMDYAIALWKHYGINWHSILYLFHRSAVEKVGGWSSQYPIYEDAEFIINILKQSSKIICAAGEYGVWRVFNDQKHLHSLVSKDIQKREADGLFHIASEILAYRDTPETKKICEQFISNHIYHHIEKFISISDYLRKKFDQQNLAWIQYKTPKAPFLFSILGWERTTYLIRKWKSFQKAVSSLIRNKSNSL